MRPYSVQQIFGNPTQLIAGTLAEGWEGELSQTIIQSATRALQVQADLAAAYFLRGWAEHLANPGDPNALADIQKAAQMAPGEPLFAQAAAFLSGQPPAPPPAPTKTPAPPVVILPVTREGINFPAGSTAFTFSPILKQGEAQGYTLTVLAQQRMYITASAGTTVVLLNQADRFVAPTSTRMNSLEYLIPSSSDYTIVLQGVGKIYVTIYIPPLPGTVVLPVPVSLQRITFAPGGTSASFTATLVQNAPQGFVLRVMAAQHVIVSATGNPTLTVLDPDDNLLTPVTASPGNWEIAIPRTGDYTLVFQGAGSVSITVTIPPLPGSTPQQVPTPATRQRITFSPGTTGTSVQVNLASGQSVGYMLGALANQTVSLVLNNPAVTLIMLDPSNHLLVPVSSGEAAGRWEYRLPANGDYMIVVQGSGQATLSIEIPPL